MPSPGLILSAAATEFPLISSALLSLLQVLILLWLSSLLRRHQPIGGQKGKSRAEKEYLTPGQSSGKRGPKAHQPDVPSAASLLLASAAGQRRRLHFGCSRRSGRRMLLFSPSAGFLWPTVSAQPQRARMMMSSEPELTSLLSTSQAETGPGGHSLADLQQIPSDLWLTRRRIEAGVQSQRRQRQILAEVQQRLAQCRLDRAQHWPEQSPRARSHSPPPTSEIHQPADLLPERPSTSQMTRRPLPCWEEAPAVDQQFSLRLALLEQRMERLNLMTGENLMSKLMASEDGQRERRGRARELGAELARLRLRIDQMRQWAQEEMMAAGIDLEQTIRAMGRRLKRELALGRRTREQSLMAELERRNTEVASLQLQVQTMSSHRSEADRRVELAERAIQQIWALPALVECQQSSTSTADTMSAENLMVAIQTALDRAQLAERNRWAEQMETLQERSQTEVDRQKQRHREELSRERREAQQKMSRREAECAAERQKLERELERMKVQITETTGQAEAAELECQKARHEADFLRDEAKAKLSEERLAKERLEAEMAAEKARMAKEMELSREQAEKAAAEAAANYKVHEEREKQQRKELEERLARRELECQKAELTMQEQRRAMANLREELRASSARLGRAESQLSSVFNQTRNLAKARKEGQEMAERLAETDTELEALKERLAAAEQRLRAERELRVAEAESADQDWERQAQLLGQLEAEKEQLTRALAGAERRAEEAERTGSARADREQQLRAELDRAKEAGERKLAEALAADQQERWADRELLDRLRAELAGKEMELLEARERAGELARQLAEAEQRLVKAGELCRKLNAELDELSERSLLSQGSSAAAEKLRADFEEANGVLALLRVQLEEQRRRNSLLEAELDARAKEQTKQRQQLEEYRVEAQHWRAELTRREVEWSNNNIQQQHRDDRLGTAEGSALELLLAKWGHRLQLAGENKGSGGGEPLADRVGTLLDTMWSRLDRTERMWRQCQEEGQTLTAQLASSRQLLLSQQAELVAKDRECQQLRSKLGRAEMVKVERETRAREEREMAEAGWRQQRRTLEQRIEELEGAMAREKADRQRQSAKVESNIIASEHQLRVQTQKLEAELTDRKRQLEESRRNEDRNTAGMAAQMTRERDKLRAELAEAQRKLQSALQRASQTQSRLDTAREEAEAAARRAEVAEKLVSESTALEATLRSELHELRLQWRRAAQEREQLRRQLREAEVAKKEIEALLARCHREASAQKQHIEALETDRRRVENLIRQTTSSRNSLDKSLESMERENAELQKHCCNLQSQVERLEREGSERTMQVHRKRVAQLEADLAKATQENRRLEKVLEQREFSQETRIGLLESRLDQTRAELESERRRRKQSQKTLGK